MNLFLYLRPERVVYLQLSCNHLINMCSCIHEKCVAVLSFIENIAYMINTYIKLLIST